MIPVSILLQRVQDILSIRVHQVGPGLPERVHDVIYEADLRLLDGGAVPVAHRAYVHVLLSFPVSLKEELLHQQADPSPVEGQRFRGVGQVGTVHQVLQDLDSVGVIV